MPLRTLLLGIVLVLITLFAALNWSAFMTPLPLSLLFANVEAPLGLIMLGVVVVLTVLFLAYLLYSQTSLLLDARRSARELHAQRALADQAEASRLVDLRTLIEERLQKLESTLKEDQTAAAGRLDALRDAVCASVEQGTNSLASYLGEVEDRLERSLSVRPESPRK